MAGQAQGLGLTQDILKCNQRICTILGQHDSQKSLLLRQLHQLPPGQDSHVIVTVAGLAAANAAAYACLHMPTQHAWAMRQCQQRAMSITCTNADVCR
jgi:type II secretory pathway predicted ATPase ExeA